MPRSNGKILCGTCFTPVGSKAFGKCPHCGAWIVDAPFGMALLYLRQLVYILLAVVSGAILIGAYVLSDPGPDRLWELALVVVGPFAVLAVAWLTYRVWYRRRYPDD